MFILDMSDGVNLTELILATNSTNKVRLDCFIELLRRSCIEMQVSFGCYNYNSQLTKAIN